MASYKGMSQQQVLDAIKNSYGIVLTIAGRLGCESRTAKRLIDRWAETKAAFEDEGNKILDICEGKVYKSAMEGDIQTAKWILSRKGKSRGWDENAAIKLDTGEPLNIKFDGITQDQISDADNVEIGGLNESTTEDLGNIDTE